MPKKILIIKHGALGDFVLALGMMKRLANLHKKDDVYCLTMSPFVEIARQTGLFKDVLVDNRPNYQLKEWYHVLKKILIDGQWDIIYDLQQSHRTRKKYLPFLRLMSRKDFCWVFPYKQQQLDMHKKRALSWGTVVEKPWKRASYVFPDLSFCRGNPNVLAQLPARFILMVPGCSAGHPYKRWPEKYFIEIAQKAGALGVESVVLGTKAETDIVNTICQGTPFARSLLGKTKLADIPAVARRALVVVGNDTGPQHMASFVHTPAVSLFCKRTERSAIKRDNITNLIAQNIEDITPDQVWRIIEPLFKKDPHEA